MAKDYSGLASYMRKGLQERGAVRFNLHKREIYVSTLQLYGSEFPGLLVASGAGESVMITPNMPVNAATFVAGRFNLQRAMALANLFNAFRDNAMRLR